MNTFIQQGYIKLIKSEIKDIYKVPKPGWAPIITEQQITILLWFLKDHVTLKTGVMAVENTSFPKYYI